MVSKSYFLFSLICHVTQNLPSFLRMAFFIIYLSFTIRFSFDFSSFFSIIRENLYFIILSMITNLKKVWATEHIRKKILFTLGMVAVYKLLSTLPVPGVNVTLLDAFTTQLRANTQLAFFGSIM